MVSKKKGYLQNDSKKKELRFTYREVLQDYVSKKRALFKLTIQLNRHQTTIKVNLVTAFISLLILPFDKYFALVPLIILLVWNVYQYKQNELVIKEYEQLKDKYEVVEDE
jgi:hypothetical protein